MFIILVIGFVFAIVSALSFILLVGAAFGRMAMPADIANPYLIMADIADPYLIRVLPLAIISTILNMIGMFKIRRETNPKKKRIEKILTRATWCLIIFSLGVPLLFIVFFITGIIIVYIIVYASYILFGYSG